LGDAKCKSSVAAINIQREYMENEKKERMGKRKISLDVTSCNPIRSRTCTNIRSECNTKNNCNVASKHKR
jgi:hypothetical protein